MKRALGILIGTLVIFSLAGCTLSLFGKSPTPAPVILPTVILPTPTALVPIPSAPPVPTQTGTLSLPTPTEGAPLPANTAVVNPPAPTASGPVIIPGNPSGPYGVIYVVAGDVLNIRSAAGASSSVVGSFAPNANNVMRTGPSSNAGGALWVEVQNPSGGTGWVNSTFLTEYVAPATFCADGRVNTLIANFGTALQTSNGASLAALVSPNHGWAVNLWRNGNTVVFDREHAQWVFASTYEHDWGAAPGSGLDTVGAIHVVVLPKYLDVFNATPSGYSLSCNTIQLGGASYTYTWPATLANINFYSVYKPGPAGNELSWRTLVIGVEYVQNVPYIFSTTQLDWEP